APGIYKGVWKSPRTEAPIHDETRRYVIAVPAGQVKRLRAVLREACRVFEQQSIYFSVAGVVEFIEAENDEEEI
ncbi:MAG: hypothetical protein HYR84_08345, partial [Planctomycetes bacterium]|nr:hypothetical protein [Planctomycetota bacterium]